MYEGVQLEVAKLTQKYGFKSTLDALISQFGNQDELLDYEQRLLDDLQKTLDNYKNRYRAPQDE